MIPPRTSGRRRTRGQSLVEFALILPAMLLVIFGMVDLGRAVFIFNSLSESARSANRVAVVEQNVSSITNRAVTTGAGMSVTVEVCYKASDSTQRDCAQPATQRCSPSGTYQREHCLAIVTARTIITPLTPIISSIIPSIPLSSTSIGPIEYACPNQLRTSCP